MGVKQKKTREPNVGYERSSRGNGSYIPAILSSPDNIQAAGFINLNFIYF